MAGRNDLIDEVGPIVWPILLEDVDQDEVEFVDQSTLAFQTIFRRGGLDDEVDDEIADA